MTRKVFNSDNFFIVSYQQEMLQSLLQMRTKHGYLIHSLLDKTVNGNIVNRALTSFHRGSLENFAYSPFKFYFLDSTLE